MVKKLLWVSIFIIFLFTIITTSSKNYITNSLMVKEGLLPKEIPIAELVIGKIGIDNYIYNYNSPNNTVEKNVELLKGSILPNDNKSIIFLAAHSGNSYISYFNNLNKLNKNDLVTFYYKNIKYIYKVNTIYELDKDGDIEVVNEAKDQLVLTTCSTTDDKKQLVVSSNLLKKESI